MAHAGISKCYSYGLYLVDVTGPAITTSHLITNGGGAYLERTAALFFLNDIYGNTNYGMYNATASVRVNAGEELVGALHRASRQLG